MMMRDDKFVCIFCCGVKSMFEWWWWWWWWWWKYKIFFFCFLHAIWIYKWNLSNLLLLFSKWNCIISIIFIIFTLYDNDNDILIWPSLYLPLHYLTTTSSLCFCFASDCLCLTLIIVSESRRASLPRLLLCGIGCRLNGLLLLLQGCSCGIVVVVGLIFIRWLFSVSIWCVGCEF